MSVLGDTADATEFLGNLDERKLVDLCADILARKGHSQIRITDGPGDGQRDIHSRNRSGETHITQSKFHGRLPQTVSSKELGELVLGMVKRGCRSGLFITNARISPQAKGECLDDYPGYAVKFMEGRDIIRRVLDDPILKAVWYDGASIDRVQYAVVIPVIARDLVVDRPVRLIPPGQDSHQLGTQRVGDTEAQVTLRRSSMTTTALEPYRPARVRTLSEPRLSNTIPAEVALHGAIRTADLSELREVIGLQLLEHARQVSGTALEHVAVRLGPLYLALLTGERSGAHIELADFGPWTLAQHGDLTLHEHDWLLPSPETGYVPPDRLSALIADWVRWYNPRLDICLDLTLVGVPGFASRESIEEQREHIVRWWTQSLFALLPATVLDRDDGRDLVDSAAQTYPWDNEQILCGWLHPNLLSPLRPLAIEPDTTDIDVEGWVSPFQADPMAVRSRFDQLQDQLTALGGEIIDPQKARHMIAVVNSDPFPTGDIVTFRSIDLLVNYSDLIPSPIEPRARRFSFTVCWRLGVPGQHIDWEQVEQARELIEKLARREPAVLACVVDVDPETALKVPYLLVHLQSIDPVGYERMDDWLELRATTIATSVDTFEGSLRARFPAIVRATREYWRNEYGVYFPDDQESVAHSGLSSW